MNTSWTPSSSAHWGSKNVSRSLSSFGTTHISCRRKYSFAFRLFIIFQTDTRISLRNVFFRRHEKTVERLAELTTDVNVSSEKAVYIYLMHQQSLIEEFLAWATSHVDLHSDYNFVDISACPALLRSANSSIVKSLGAAVPRFESKKWYLSLDAIDRLLRLGSILVRL